MIVEQGTSHVVVRVVTMASDVFFGVQCPVTQRAEFPFPTVGFPKVQVQHKFAVADAKTKAMVLPDPSGRCKGDWLLNPSWGSAYKFLKSLC